MPIQLWATQEPIGLETAKTMRLDVARSTMMMARDEWTNMIAPFGR
jgi:short subunit fatty acids transporter